ncbi:MAG: ribosome maturation factor RimP [Lachnospirales bacterium]
MTNKELIKVITAYMEPIEAELSVELVDVEYVKEGPNMYLRLYIDKEGGVDIIACEGVSRKIEAILDEKDPIKDPYILEVSSPGLDRPLKKEEDYKKFAGEIVDIKLYKGRNGTKEFQGELVGLFNEEVKIIIDDKEEVFSLNEIAICRLAVIF